MLSQQSQRRVKIHTPSVYVYMHVGYLGWQSGAVNVLYSFECKQISNPSQHLIMWILNSLIYRNVGKTSECLKIRDCFLTWGQ